MSFTVVSEAQCDVGAWQLTPIPDTPASAQHPPVDHEGTLHSLPDLIARVAHLQTQMEHVRRAQRSQSNTSTAVTPSPDLLRAKAALRSAWQGVEDVEREMAARVKGNEARISRMEKKLLAMRREG